MKKILTLTIAAVLVFSLVSCAKKDKEDVTPGTSAADVQKNGPKSALEILETVWKKYSADDKFAAMGGSEKNMKEDAPGKFDLGDAEALDFELGFPKAEVGKLDDAASLLHMLNQNTFTCGVYHVKNSADIEALAAKIKDNILARNWMCGFPEKLVIMTVGDYIVSVFGAAELISTFTAKLTDSYGSVRHLFDVPIA